MDIILWLQSSMSGSTWDTFWYLWSKVYSIDFILMIIPIAFWVTKRSFARQLSTLLVVQIWALTALKGIIGVHRPADARIRINEVDVEGMYSRPSGHATGIATLFGGLSLEIRKKWFTLIAAIVIFMVGVSRLYLGVHWPMDILLGWCFGLALAYGMRYCWGSIEGLLKRMQIGLGIAIALIIPAIMLLAWTLIPSISRVGLEFLYPALGALSGAWIGSLIEERHLDFDPKGTLAWHVVKCCIGLLLVFGLRMGIKAMLPVGDLFDYVRYGCIGLFITLGAPWLFSLLPWAPQNSIVASMVSKEGKTTRAQ